MRPLPSSARLRAAFAAGVVGLSAAATALAIPAASASAAQPTSLTITSASAGTGVNGKIKHVWLIILENKSYDASFTGLNKNSYLWQTLPAQGALLKNYYGTGHTSQDNYESLVSGQAPSYDIQSDCSVAATNFSSSTGISDGSSGGIITSGTADQNLGQAVSAAGPNAKNGLNGCVFPTQVPTLFNQLDLAGKTWKGYMQDLGNQPGREDGACGYPGTSTNTPTGTVDTAGYTGTHSNSTALNTPANYPGVASFTGVQAAGKDASGAAGAKEDGYVAKHNPFPWFHSLLDGTVTTPANGGADCDANHVVNLDDASKGLVADLQQPAASVPNLSWITPNNCSDAHDATCKGNNLSGAFNADGTPNYQTGGVRAYDPQGSTPKNYTGGLYASDLFLKWYVPLIEQSAAFQDGGLIDVTFDEGNPPFTNSSFNNANDPTFASNLAGSPDTPNPSNLHDAYIAADAAGQNINGQNVSTEPTGPNAPNTKNSASSTLPSDANSTCPSTQTYPCPGPGYASFIDRTPKAASNNQAVTNGSGNIINDQSIVATDLGRAVYSGATTSGTFLGYVGAPSNTGPTFPTTNASSTATVGSFGLVDANGALVTPPAGLTAISLGPEDGATTSAGVKDPTDPVLDTTTFTQGGGDTGAVLISPFITPGTVSTTFYNHYSWLRTMEDLFNVSTPTAGDVSLTAGSVAKGLDGQGHIGYAAQTGLAPFGSDVFTNPSGVTASPNLPEAPLAIGLPLAALVLGGGFMIRRRRRASAGSVLA